MKKAISVITLISLILGIFFGFYGRDLVGKIEFVGSTYITVLKYLILPVIFTSISVSIYQSAGNREFLVLRAVVLFLGMFVISFLLSSVIVLLIDPAKGAEFLSSETAVSTLDIRIGDFFINLLPKDIAGLFTGKYLFFIIVLSYLFGLISHRTKAEKVINVIIKIRDFCYRILNYLQYVTPMAVFSLIATAINRFGMDTIMAGLKYILTAYVCGIAVLVIVMILPLKYYCRLPLRELLRKISPIWLITLSTCSSAATLPYTIKLCREDLKIDPDITDIVVPLGCTIHMCGGAVSFSLLGLFCARAFGLNLDLGAYLYMLMIAVILNMSAPGIPSGGVVIGATYLEMMGLPLTFIGLYTGIYKILDMLYTTLNVTGDISANVILDHIIKKEK
ncbi:MAG: dicarboxylate/amino acid:cation symporter [Erysipelotrichaceae bacterium]|nr:dicarboxylate/amino acid:cation symporter [Erysipelotrichaceae bacterium]